jgi:hypothetical protein
MKLLKKEIDIIFKKRIEKKDEDLFVMKYNVLSQKIKGLIKSFTVDAKRFKELLLANEGKSYCKFYFLEKNNTLNIGLSFSDNIDCPIIDNEDILYVLNNDLFIESNSVNFNNLVNAFEIGIGSELEQLTKIKTSLVYYDFDIVDAYLATLGLHFPLNKLKFNMLQFRNEDLDNIIIPCSIGKDSRISFCVHTLINRQDDKNVLVESDGYDLGNLRP